MGRERAREMGRGRIREGGDREGEKKRERKRMREGGERWVREIEMGRESVDLLLFWR